METKGKEIFMVKQKPRKSMIWYIVSFFSFNDLSFHDFNFYKCPLVGLSLQVTFQQTSLREFSGLIVIPEAISSTPVLN